jgi:hypothetical protein
MKLYKLQTISIGNGKAAELSTAWRLCMVTTIVREHLSLYLFQLKQEDNLHRSIHRGLIKFHIATCWYVVSKKKTTCWYDSVITLGTGFGVERKTKTMFAWRFCCKVGRKFWELSSYCLESEIFSNTVISGLMQVIGPLPCLPHI